jgi:hypothetical protein
MTYTYVTMEVSAAAYLEIAAKLREAGYDHAFGEDGELDMRGIALTHAFPMPTREAKAIRPSHVVRK